ncbi:hypothetical protein [Yoonia sp. 2307UL14-13]|uniref:hypothetical protein n=1 Tax=Yoonia sp. 2307UL14-13 TaxID=3126506 RepID=UPI00309EDF66
MIFFLAELPLAIFAIGLGAVGGWAVVFVSAWVFQFPMSQAKIWSAVKVLIFGAVAFCPFVAMRIMGDLPSDGSALSSVVGLLYSYGMGVFFVLFLWLTGRFVRQELGQFGVLRDDHNRNARLSACIGAGSMILTVVIGLIR